MKFTKKILAFLLVISLMSSILVPSNAEDTTITEDTEVTEDAPVDFGMEGITHTFVPDSDGFLFIRKYFKFTPPSPGVYLFELQPLEASNMTSPCPFSSLPFLGFINNEGMSTGVNMTAFLNPEKDSSKGGGYINKIAKECVEPEIFKIEGSTNYQDLTVNVRVSLITTDSHDNSTAGAQLITPNSPEIMDFIEYTSDVDYYLVKGDPGTSPEDYDVNLNMISPDSVRWISYSKIPAKNGQFYVKVYSYVGSALHESKHLNPSKYSLSVSRVKIKGKLTYLDKDPRGNIKVPLAKHRIELFCKVGGKNSDYMDSAITNDNGEFEIYKPGVGFYNGLFIRVSAQNEYVNVVTSKDGRTASTVVFESNALEAPPIVSELDFGEIVIAPKTPEEKDVSGAFSIARSIYEGASFVKNSTGHTPESRNVYWYGDECIVSKGSTSFFNPRNKIIYIQDKNTNTAFNKSVILHEYGHAIWDMIGLNFKYVKNEQHNVFGINDPGFAMTEGWATYFGQSALSAWEKVERPIYTLNKNGSINIENYANSYNKKIPRDKDNEISNAAVLWDLADIAGETKIYSNGFGSDPFVPKTITIKDELSDSFKNIYSVFNNTQIDSIRYFWDGYFEKGYGKANPYKTWEVFDLNGMNFDTEPPFIKNTTISGSTITADVTDNIKVSHVVFMVPGYPESALIDETAPFQYTIDPTMFTTGSHTLQILAYDPAGQSTGLVARTIDMGKTITDTSNSDTSISHEITANDEVETIDPRTPSEEDYRSPCSTTLYPFTVLNGSGSITPLNVTTNGITKAVTDNGYKPLATLSTTMDKTSSIPIYNFQIKKGCDYNLMLESNSGIFDVEILKPDGTVYKKIINPSVPRGIELRDAEAGLWGYRIVPSLVPYSSAVVAHGVGEKPSVVKITDIKEYTSQNIQSIKGTASFSSTVELTVNNPLGVETVHSAEVGNDGVFTFSNLQFQDGISELNFKSVNSDGYKGSSIKKYVEVDKLAPEIDAKLLTRNIVTVLKDDVSNKIYGEIYDLYVGADKDVELYVNGILVNTFDTDGIYYKTTPQIPDGKSNLVIKAIDKAGNETTKSYNIIKDSTITYENILPNIKNIGMSEIISDTETFTQTFYDDSPIEKVEAFLQDSKGLREIYPISIDSNGKFTIDPTKYESKYYYLYVYVTDIWNNSSYRGYGVTIQNQNQTASATPTPTVTPTVPATPTSAISCDINGDKSINMADVMILAKHFNTNVLDIDFDEKCDLNSDGSINMADVMLIATKFNTVL